MNQNYDLIVIGGGPAGMMAAGTAAANGLSVLLADKNEKLGKKLYLTGKGRCNLTNESDFNNFIANTVSNKKFLYSALKCFSAQQLCQLMNDLGLSLKTERGGRVFPQSDKSSDVIKALQKYLTANGANVCLGQKVKKILTEEESIAGVLLEDGRIIPANAVLIACGGISYPQTGSSGDGYRLAQELGHSIVTPKPALVPLLSREQWPKELQGLSLKNVAVEAIIDKKHSYRLFGEMLFTHFGLSGPIILSLSSLCKDYLNSIAISDNTSKTGRPLKLTIDLKPALSEEQLANRIQRDLEKYCAKQLKNSLDELLPQRLIPVILQLSGLDAAKQSNQINKKERAVLVRLIKNLPVTVTGTRSAAEAIITSGGINVKEINSSTMESRLVSDLYFAGEVIDVDALTGGYNLQIAFSTGYLSGLSCARRYRAQQQ